MFCIKCGKEIPDKSNYCLHCGILLSGNDVNNITKTNTGKTLIVVNYKRDIIWGLFKIKIIINDKVVKTVKAGRSVSFEIENGKHIIFCEGFQCKGSEPIEINGKSNEIHFSVEFSPDLLTAVNKLILTKTAETEMDAWGVWE